MVETREGIAKIDHPLDRDHYSQDLFNIESVKGLTELADEYPFLKNYNSIFSSLVKRGVEQFSLCGVGDNGIVISTSPISDEHAGFVLKIPKPGSNHDILKEYDEHINFLNTLYAGYNDPKFGKILENISIPQISTLSTDKGKTIVMDRLPGKTLKRCLYEKIFSPLFINSKLQEDLYLGDVLQYPNHEVYLLVDELNDQIASGEMTKEDIVDAKYLNYDIKTLKDIACDIDHTRDDHLLILRKCLGAYHANKLSEQVIAFSKYCHLHYHKHPDFHNDNKILTSGGNGSENHYNLGVIDFGKG